MGDLTLTDRVYALEDQVKDLTATLKERLASVVLVEKRKPGPAVKSVSERFVKQGLRDGRSRKGPQIRKGFVKADA